MAAKPTSPAIDAAQGGAALLVYGRVSSSRASTDQSTGEVKHFVQIEWWGGNKYFITDPASDLAKVKEGDMVELHQPYTFGKNGARQNGDPLLIASGKAAS